MDPSPDFSPPSVLRERSKLFGFLPFNTQSLQLATRNFLSRQCHHPP
jgi:hypothetical protein